MPPHSSSGMIQLFGSPKFIRNWRFEIFYQSNVHLHAAANTYLRGICVLIRS